MPSIDDMLSLYTRAMRSMHACIEPCIEKTLPIHARSYFMSGNMSAHVNIYAKRKIFTPDYELGIPCAKTLRESCGPSVTSSSMCYIHGRQIYAHLVYRL